MLVNGSISTSINFQELGVSKVCLTVLLILDRSGHYAIATIPRRTKVTASWARARISLLGAAVVS